MCQPRGDRYRCGAQPGLPLLSARLQLAGSRRSIGLSARRQSVSVWFDRGARLLRQRKAGHGSVTGAVSRFPPGRWARRWCRAAGCWSAAPGRGRWPSATGSERLLGDGGQVELGGAHGLQVVDVALAVDRFQLVAAVGVLLQPELAADLLLEDVEEAAAVVAAGAAATTLSSLQQVFEAFAPGQSIDAEQCRGQLPSSRSTPCCSAKRFSKVSTGRALALAARAWISWSARSPPWRN